MNASNVCSFVGRLPKPRNDNSDAFALTYVEKDESQGRNVSRFSATLSVKRTRKNKDEQYYPEDLIRFTAFGPTADFLGTYAKKGDTLAIMGELHIDTYQNREGNTVTTHSILVDSANLLSPRQGDNDSADDGNNGHQERRGAGETPKPSFQGGSEQKPKSNNPFRRSGLKGSEN